MKLYPWILGLFLILISCKKNPIHLQRIEGKQISISDEFVSDSIVIDLVSPYKENLESDMNEVLAYAPIDLIRNRDMVETNIGNFMADLCHKHGNAVFKEKTGNNVDFVLLNIGA